MSVRRGAAWVFLNSEASPPPPPLGRNDPIYYYYSEPTLYMTLPSSPTVQAPYYPRDASYVPENSMFFGNIMTRASGAQDLYNIRYTTSSSVLDSSDYCYTTTPESECSLSPYCTYCDGKCHEWTLCGVPVTEPEPSVAGAVVTTVVVTMVLSSVVVDTFLETNLGEIMSSLGDVSSKVWTSIATVQTSALVVYLAHELPAEVAAYADSLSWTVLFYDIFISKFMLFLLAMVTVVCLVSLARVSFDRLYVKTQKSKFQKIRDIARVKLLYCMLRVAMFAYLPLMASAWYAVREAVPSVVVLALFCLVTIGVMWPTVSMYYVYGNVDKLESLEPRIGCLYADYTVHNNMFKSVVFIKQMLIAFTLGLVEDMTTQVVMLACIEILYIVLVIVKYPLFKDKTLLILELVHSLIIAISWLLFLRDDDGGDSGVGASFINIQLVATVLSVIMFAYDLYRIMKKLKAARKKSLGDKLETPKSHQTPSDSTAVSPTPDSTLTVSMEDDKATSV